MKTNHVKKLLFSILFIYSAFTISAQTTIGRQLVDQYPITSSGTKTYGLTWLPADYYSTTESYPLIIFLHGSGEVGDGVQGLNNLIKQGLPKKIAGGWDPQAINPVDGKIYKFIVVSPQAPTSSAWSYSYTHVMNILPDVLKRYRIDSSRIYITGISAGGAGTWSSVTNDGSFTKKIAAIIPVSSVGVNNPDVEYPNIKYISGKYGVSVWTVCGTQDGHYSTAIDYVNIINSAIPAPVVPAVVTGIPGLDHVAGVWDMVYDSSWRSNTFNLNFYEWMLQYRRDVAIQVNQPPVVNAGVDKSITLPTNTVTLNGSATDADGTISSYLWTKVSGPAQFTIVSANQRNTTVNDLVAGTYQFELTATDNDNAKGKDTIAVTVLQANQPPVARAGIDKTISLPVDSITLNGSGTDADGTITSYSWTKISGPSQFTISNSNIASPLLSKLTAGTYTFRLTVTDNDQATDSDDINITVNPLNNNYETIPARIEAESYTAMNGIQTEATSDIGEGSDVGWIDNGDWMDYNVYVPSTGIYTVKFRIATVNTGAKFQLDQADGSVLTTVNLPSTGSYQGWITLNEEVSLTEGYQTLRIISTASPAWNLNWMEFINGTIPPIPIPAKIEAETYDAMQGIQMQTTSDVNGGLNIGWIDNGDWMDYIVDAASRGIYTVNLRIAAVDPGAELEIRNSNGAVLATVTIPNTGSYQKWATVSTTISIPAGKQTLRIISTADVNWNLNWIDFDASSGLTAKSTNNMLQSSDEGLAKQKLSSFEVSPNPVSSNFVLQINSKNTGVVKVQIVNMHGAIMKEFRLYKDVSGTQTFKLPSYNLSTGKYIVHLQLKNWSDSKFILKL